MTSWREWLYWVSNMIDFLERKCLEWTKNEIDFWEGSTKLEIRLSFSSGGTQASEVLVNCVLQMYSRNKDKIGADHQVDATPSYS